MSDFSCHAGCCGCSMSRRSFLRGCGSAATLAAATVIYPRGQSRADDTGPGRVRVAAVFLSNIEIHEIWPYPGFDTQSRQQQVLAALSQGCPDVEFVPVVVKKPDDVQQAVALKDQVDGYLIYEMTLDWAQVSALVNIALVGKPTLVVDEFLGGSGAFLVGVADLRTRGVPVAAVSSTRLEDMALVARQFATLRQSGVTRESFVDQCQKVYRTTFPAAREVAGCDDSLSLTPIGECVKRLRDARFLIVGAGPAGQEQDFLGAKGRYIDFDELGEFYQQVDADQAVECANQWKQQAQSLPAADYVDPATPTEEAIRNAAAVYLATRQLLKKYDTDSVTMNCLGGFAAGKLPAYPCLGFMQLLNDGGQGVCEAMPDDTVSMLMARILTGRPGFVSDPALDTSRNQIVYAHCVGTTKVLGPAGAANGYYIRTLHNRDPRGACAESLMPADHMTTSFRTNFAQRKMVIHQAKSLGPLDSERGCRTKLLAEVRGDIAKLFDRWSQFGWHRVTVFGDVQQPLTELGKALGLEVIEEA